MKARKEPKISRKAWFARREIWQLFREHQKIDIGRYGEIEVQFDGEVDLRIHAALDSGFQPHEQRLCFYVPFVAEFSSTPDVMELKAQAATNCTLHATNTTTNGFVLEVLVPPHEEAVLKMHLSWRACGAAANPPRIARAAASDNHMPSPTPIMLRRLKEA
ncbi:hypothetical protein [Celeribacter sp.]|uniref:hypothetical protein n=1 Tax=Celeribacter sp. TaxID=1890673 RepID=UPI003A8EDBA8